MKKRASIPKTLVLSLSLAVSCGAFAGVRAEPPWVLNHGSAVSRAILVDAVAEDVFGLCRLNVFGKDVSLRIPMSEEEEFLAAERPFFGV